MKKDKIKTALMLSSPLLLAVAVMLPRLLSSDFSLFDDGRIILILRELAHHMNGLQREYQDGRFTPIYWLVFSLPYILFGVKPLWYFIVNLILFIFTTAALIYLVNRLTGNKIQAMLSGILFVLSGSAIENYFTISKKEPAQVFWLILALVAWSSSLSIKGRKGTLLFGLTSLLFLFANLSKEISFVTIPIAAGCYIVSWGYRKLTKTSFKLSPNVNLLLATVLGGLVAYGMRWIVIGKNVFSGAYTRNYVLDLPRSVANSVYLFQWVARDYAFLLPLLLLAVIVIVKNKQLGYGLLLLNLIVWMLGWTVIYFPWIYILEYYLLPFALGASVLGGIAIERFYRLFAGGSTGHRIWIGLTLIFTLTLFVTTLFNNYANARAELALDAANREILDFIGRHAPANSVVLVNLPQSEYTIEIGIELAEIQGRRDITVYPFNYQVLDRADKIQYYIISPFINNSVLTTIRIGIGGYAKDWNTNSQAYLSQETWTKKSIANYHVPLVTFDPARTLCPLIGEKNFCRLHANIIENGDFIYGWDVYTLELR